MKEVFLVPVVPAVKVSFMLLVFRVADWQFVTDNKRWTTVLENIGFFDKTSKLREACGHTTTPKVHFTNKQPITELHANDDAAEKTDQCSLNQFTVWWFHDSGESWGSILTISLFWNVEMGKLKKWLLLLHTSRYVILKFSFNNKFGS